MASMFEFLTDDENQDVIRNILGGVGSAGGAALAKSAADDIGKIGREAFQRLSTGYTDPDTGDFTPGLASNLEERLAFQPYTVTSATGSNFTMRQKPDTVLPDGTTVPGEMEFISTLSDAEKDLQDNQLRRAESFFNLAEANTATREQEVFDRMRAAMLPEEERQRLALEERLANQGRLGVRTSMFGGTPEQLALAQAQEEAKNRAMLSAMEFAGAEQLRQSQLGTGMLASGYVPQAQLLSAVEPGMTAAERQRQALAQQTATYGETYATGLEALLQSALGQANLIGNFGANLATSSLGGLFGGNT